MAWQEPSRRAHRFKVLGEMAPEMYAPTEWLSPGRIAGLINPIAPVLYRCGDGGLKISCSEQYLLLAILSRAIKDCAGHDMPSIPPTSPQGREQVNQRLVQKAYDWCQSNSQNLWGYLWICDHLCLNPHRLRGNITRVFYGELKLPHVPLAS